MRAIFLAVFFFCSSCYAQEAPAQSEVLEYAKTHLTNSGTLQFSSGFAYVEVDDEYIFSLLPFIEKVGFIAPPYFGREDLVGAHVTVIYPHEVIEYGIQEIPECGQVISFTPKDCMVVHPPRMQDVDEVYFIVVEAPELDAIREKYGLPKRQYEFHITIGVKPKE